MINLLLGQPGGGKSYESVAFHVIPALTAGRKIITNLPLKVDVLEQYFPGAASLIEMRNPELGQTGVVRPFSAPEHYGDDWRHPESGAGALYIIDECHLALPRVGTKLAVEEWFSLHRHEGADVLLITQSYGKISPSIRDLVQVVYRCKKATAFGSNERYIRKVQDGIRGEVVNTSMRSYESKYFQFYKSHTRSNTAVSELAANDIVPLWKRWPFRGAALCFIMVIGMSVYNTTRPKKPVAQVKPPVTAPAPVRPSVPEPAAGPTVIAADPLITATPHGPDERLHPYQGYEFHLQATLQGRKTLPDGSKVDYIGGFVSITKDGQNPKTISFDDLKQAGYDITLVSNGIITMGYKGLDLGYVIADSPRVTLQPTTALTKNGK